MTLDKTKLYVFLLRDADGECIGCREWDARRRQWKTTAWPLNELCGYGLWRTVHSETPFWRNGPRMVLEVPA